LVGGQNEVDQYCSSFDPENLLLTPKTYVMFKKIVIKDKWDENIENFDINFWGEGGSGVKEKVISGFPDPQNQ